jgi:Ribose 5-phosphate isomerase A (phosphoriboisomerase A)
MPVEIVQFCWKYNLQRLQALPEVAGSTAKLRTNADGTPYVTDNSNYIVDLYFDTPIKARALLKPIGYAWSYLTRTIGYLVPILSAMDRILVTVMSTREHRGASILLRVM